MTLATIESDVEPEVEDELADGAAMAKLIYASNGFTRTTVTKRSTRTCRRSFAAARHVPNEGVSGSVDACPSRAGTLSTRR
jgi:hypothetical protein